MSILDFYKVLFTPIHKGFRYKFWPIITPHKLTKGEKLKPTAILTDKTSGFADPEFWGEYNIIEPEKSIEVAIKKINRKLKRTES